MTHLGERVTALVDGRLAVEEEERCWSHVLECHSCRDLVEHEGWVKTRLAQLSFGPSATSETLKSSLRSHPSALLPARFPLAEHRSRRGLVAIGGGAASACVVGVLALGVAGSARMDPLPPVSDLSRPTAPRSPTAPTSQRVDPPRRDANSVSRPALTERLSAIREKIAP